MFPRSSPPNARTALKWSGPVLAGLGVGAIFMAVMIASESPLARWILAETLAPARVLPLIGFGAGLALLGARALIAALLLLGFGIAAGLFAEDRLLAILDLVPHAATHLFLTGPIAYLATGATLVASARWREWLAPIMAAIFGAIVALTVKLTDPSLHEAAFTWTPVLIAFWIVGAIALTLRAFWRSWFPVFGRILGSWLLAIGLLYGTASVVPITAPPPAVDQPMEDAVPRGVNPLRQP